MMPPKDDLVALTGGYRGTPVLQIGADVYIDSQRIARELERRFPAADAVSRRQRRPCLAMVKWADAFFRAGLHLAIGLTSAGWPPEFRMDRQQLFPDIDFAQRRCASMHGAVARARELHRSAIERWSRFPGGPAPGLWDIHAWTVPWFARASMPVVNAVARRSPATGSLGARVADSARAAHGVHCRRGPLCRAIASTPETGPRGPRRRAGPDAGMLVDVMPDDTRRGAVRGPLSPPTERDRRRRSGRGAARSSCISAPRISCAPRHLTGLLQSEPISAAGRSGGRPSRRRY